MAQNRNKAEDGDAIRKDTDVSNTHPARREKDVVTEGSEDSFPASDPPSFMGGSAISGSPPSRKTPRQPEEEKSKDDPGAQKG